MRNETQDSRPDERNYPIISGSTDGSPRNAVLTPEQATEIKRSLAGAKPRRKFRFHVKFVESDRDRRLIEGYASTRDLDRTGDVVQPGAFEESLREFLANPVVTYMHDWSNPIGKVIDARIDEVGLFIRAEISETADRVWKLIEEGILRAFSIGYEVVDEKVIEGLNHILRLRLYEVAIVSIPANRRALFSVSKALEAGDDLVERQSADVSSEKNRYRRSCEHAAEPAFSDSELVEAKTILREVMDKLGTGGHAPAKR